MVDASVQTADLVADVPVDPRAGLEPNTFLLAAVTGSVQSTRTSSVSPNNRVADGLPSCRDVLTMRVTDKIQRPSRAHRGEAYR